MKKSIWITSLAAAAALQACGAFTLSGAKPDEAPNATRDEKKGTNTANSGTRLSVGEPVAPAEAGGAWRRTINLIAPKPDYVVVEKRKASDNQFRSVGFTGPDGTFIDTDISEAAEYRVGGILGTGVLPGASDMILPDRICPSQFNSHGASRIVVPRTGVDITCAAGLHLKGKILRLEGRMRIFDNDLSGHFDEIQSDGGAIETFPQGTKAGLQFAGRSAGAIHLQAKKASGRLAVVGYGEDGGAGKPGDRGAPGAAGHAGLDGKSRTAIHLGSFSISCERQPTPGDVGQLGHEGHIGGPGRRGGDSAEVMLVVGDSTDFDFAFVGMPGLGGQGGPGGPGGFGGIGGEGGRRDPEEQCEESKARGLPGAMGPTGPQGPMGESGLRKTVSLQSAGENRVY